MTSNMPILWQNCIMQYKTEIAKKAWVWFAESYGHGMHYQSDNFASEVERLVLSIQPMLKSSSEHHGASDEVCNDLLRFILVRHANWRVGGNVNPTYI